jgi:hypothetical protein
MIFRLGFLTFLYKYKEYYKQIKKLNNISSFQCFNFLGLKIIKNILRMREFHCERYDLFFLRNTHELLVGSFSRHCLLFLWGYLFLHLRLFRHLGLITNHFLIL